MSEAPTSRDYEAELTRIHEQGSRYARRLAYFAGTVFVLLSFVTGWALYSRFEQTNHNRAANAAIWHAVICDIELSVIHDADASYEQKVRFVKFYDKLLVEDAHAAPCGLTPRRAP